MDKTTRQLLRSNELCDLIMRKLTDHEPISTDGLTRDDLAFVVDELFTVAANLRAYAQTLEGLTGMEGPDLAREREFHAVDVAMMAPWEYASHKRYRDEVWAAAYPSKVAR